MQKITHSLIGLAILLFAFSANAAGLGEGCNVGADCDDSVYCNGIESCSSEGSVCVAGTPVECGDQYCDEVIQGCVDCLTDGDCDDGEYCNGDEICDAGGDCLSGVPVDCGDGFCNEDIQGCAECEEDLDCPDNGTPFCSDTLECVECLEDLDCEAGEICELGECIEESLCSLFIKPPKLNLKKGVRPIKQMFTIKGVKGEEGFDPTGEIDFGPCEIVELFVAGNSDVLKVRIIVPDNATFESDFLDVQVGECTGQVFLKKPSQKQLEKQLLKEQKKQEKLTLKEQKRLEKEAKKAAKKAAKEAKKAAK